MGPDVPQAGVPTAVVLVLRQALSPSSRPTISDSDASRPPTVCRKPGPRKSSRTSKDSIWFGTQYGINRYDGYEFRVFVHDPKQPNSLCGTYVHALFKDRSGMLWIGCNQLVDRFDPRTETFVHYRVEPDGADNQNMSVLHISQDHEGLLWLATNAGLHSLDPATGAVRHFLSAPERPDGLSTNDIKWTGEDRSGSFWVGSRNGPG